LRNDAFRNSILLLQLAQLIGRKVPPPPRRQPLGFNPRERRTREPHDPEAGRISHPTYLQVSPFRDGELKPGFVRLVPQELHFSGQRLAILELDASAPSIDVLGLHDSLELDDVRLRRGPTRVQ
jgi:hypothetical protein